MKCIVGDHEFTREEYEDVESRTINAWELIKNIFVKAVNYVKDIVMSFIDGIRKIVKHPPVGLKKKFKQSELRYYESISEGRSNNWRKNHGLPLIRSL